MNRQEPPRPNVIASLPSPPSQIPGLDLSYRDTASYRNGPFAQPPKSKGSSFLSTIGNIGKGLGSVLGSVGNSLLGGIPGAIGGIFSSIFGNKQAKENRRFQAEQAQIQRDFNHAEAELSRQFSEMMWNKNNEWNLPINQMRRLSDAGINPAMYYSSGTGLQNAAPVESSPQAYSNASPSGSSSDFSGISHAGDAFNIARLNAAQASKLENEAQQIAIDNLTRDLANRSLITLRNSSVDLNFSRVNFTNVQAQEAAKNLEVMDANISKIQAQTAESLAQGRLLNIEALFKEATFKDVVRQVSLETGMKENEARFQMQYIILDIVQKQANIALSQATAANQWNQASYYRQYTDNLTEIKKGLVVENGIKGLQFKHNYYTFDSSVAADIATNEATSDTAEALAWIKVVGTGLGSLAGVALPFIPGVAGLKLAKHIPIKGFGK